jgi:hypothetical protein
MSGPTYVRVTLILKKKPQVHNVEATGAPDRV